MAGSTVTVWAGKKGRLAHASPSQAQAADQAMRVAVAAPVALALLLAVRADSADPLTPRWWCFQSGSSMRSRKQTVICRITSDMPSKSLGLVTYALACNA